MAMLPADAFGIMLMAHQSGYLALHGLQWIVAVRASMTGFFSRGC